MSKLYLDFKGSGNRKIHYRKWVPKGPVKGTVQLVHGMVEHMDRYDDFAYFLNEQGYAVYGHDHRGHGKTGTLNGFVYFEETDGWQVAISDLLRLSEIIESEFAPLPHYILGHSMGSYMLRGALLQKSDYTGVILTGSGFMSPVERVLFTLILALNLGGRRNDKSNVVLNNLLFLRSNDQFKPTRTAFDWLSKNEENVDAYINDPLCGQIPTTSFFKDLFQGIGLACDAGMIEGINSRLPLFILTGEKDPTAGDKARLVERMYKSHLKEVSLKVYEDCRHEILNEWNKEDIYRDIVAWMVGYESR